MGAGKGLKKPDEIEPLCYMESIQEGHPPPFGERQEPSTPIIFRAKKVEKSRLGRLEKISEKICGKMFRGKGKPPILWKGGEGR